MPLHIATLECIDYILRNYKAYASATIFFSSASKVDAISSSVAPSDTAERAAAPSLCAARRFPISVSSDRVSVKRRGVRT